MSGVEIDGAALETRCFSIDRSLLAFNSLRHGNREVGAQGICHAPEGLAAVRNPLAHEPKILWDGEDDAADYLSMVSLFSP